MEPIDYIADDYLIESSPTEVTTHTAKWIDTAIHLPVHFFPAHTTDATTAPIRSPIRRQYSSSLLTVKHPFNYDVDFAILEVQIPDGRVTFLSSDNCLTAI